MKVDIFMLQSLLRHSVIIRKFSLILGLGLAPVCVAQAADVGVGSDTVLEKIVLKDSATGRVVSEQLVAVDNAGKIVGSASNRINVPADYGDGSRLQIEARVRVKANSPAQNKKSTLAVRMTLALLDGSALLSKLDVASPYELYQGSVSRSSLLDKALKIHSCFEHGVRNS